MKQYLLFGGREYYSAGGFKDLKGDFDTVVAAVHVGKILSVAEDYIEWYHVVDSYTGTIVATN